MLADINVLSSSLSSLQKIQTSFSTQGSIDMNSADSMFAVLLSLKPFKEDIAKADEA
jgi:hypothetical protein